MQPTTGTCSIENPKRDIPKTSVLWNRASLSLYV